MTQGIYCYIDKKDNSIIYIGKDSYIDKKNRHNAHFHKSFYNAQPINRILQKNPNRYEYKNIEVGNISQKILNSLEMCFIQKYNPKFNFTKGGDGCLGRIMPQSTRDKISNSNMGNTNWLGKHHSEETKKKMSKNHAKFWLNKNHSEESMIKMSEFKNNSGYFRVSIVKNNKLKNGFYYRYRYYDKNKKRKSISDVNIKHLEQKVRKKGLKWKKF